MKTRLSVILIVAAFSAMAQGNTSFGNFKLVDQEIIYQKIFLHDSVTIAKLAEYYKTLPYLANVGQSGEEITFDFNDLIVDYKKFQFTQVGTPSIIQTGKYSGKATVGVKDGKYRLTLSSLQLTGDIGYKKINAKENLTSFAAKNNGTILAQDWCRPNMLGLLDQCFTDKLQFIEEKKKKKDSSDW